MKNRPITEPLYQLAVTLDQLQDLQTLLETTSAGEADPDAKVFQLLHLVRKTRIEAVKFAQRNQERVTEVLGRLSDVQKQQRMAAWEALCSKSVAAEDLENWNTQMMDEVGAMLNEKLINQDEADALLLRAEFRWTAENARPDDPTQ